MKVLKPDDEYEFSVTKEETQIALTAIEAALDHEIKAYEEFCDEHDDEIVGIDKNHFLGFVDTVRLFKHWVGGISEFNQRVYDDAVGKNCYTQPNLHFRRLGTILSMMPIKTYVEIWDGEDHDEPFYYGTIRDLGTKMGKCRDWTIDMMQPITCDNEEDPENLPCHAGMQFQCSNK